jgi:predicted RNA binding protein YcfA (HicA-like mRNA interferase family)
MSPKLKRLSGKQVVLLLKDAGFLVYSQKGDHVKLKRTNTAGEKETLTVPLHDDLDLGTLQAIVRQARRYVPDDQLRLLFYSE